MKTTIIQLILSFIILCARRCRPDNSSGCPTAGRRLSWRQHGRRAKCPFESHQWRFQYRGWLAFAAQRHYRRVSIRLLARRRSSEIMVTRIRLVGTGALLSNSTGIQNTATGAFALFGNTGPADNPQLTERVSLVALTPPTAIEPFSTTPRGAVKYGHWL